MTSLADPSAAQALKQRIAAITPAHQRQWGKMDVAQMLAHCAVGFEWAIGESRPPRMFMGRLLGGMMKKKVLADDAPLRKNTPTAPQLIMVGTACEFSTEQQRLSALIDRFVSGGPAACTTHPHTFFGPMTPAEWSILLYKHTDHHLRQFGA